MRDYILAPEDREIDGDPIPEDAFQQDILPDNHRSVRSPSDILVFHGQSVSMGCYLIDEIYSIFIIISWKKNDSTDIIR